MAWKTLADQARDDIQAQEDGFFFKELERGHFYDRYDSHGEAWCKKCQKTIMEDGTDICPIQIVSDVMES